MKALLFVLAVSLSPAVERLPEMSDKTEWLGYFMGWGGRSADFGIGADGELMLFPKKGKERMNFKEVKIRYLVEEEMNGRWVRRKLLPEGGLASENTKGLDPKGPVVLVTTVTGDTKVEWTHVVSRGEVSIKPKLLDKKTKNKIRLGVEFAFPRLYRFDEAPGERELKKKVGKDTLKATRLKDKKTVKVKFHEVDKKLSADEFLADGASQVEVESKALVGKIFSVENGGDKVGRIDVQHKSPLYNAFRMTWMADSEKLGEKDCYVTFSVE